MRHEWTDADGDDPTSILITHMPSQLQQWLVRSDCRVYVVVDHVDRPLPRVTSTWDRAAFEYDAWTPHPATLEEVEAGEWKLHMPDDKFGWVTPQLFLDRDQAQDSIQHFLSSPVRMHDDDDIPF